MASEVKISQLPVIPIVASDIAPFVHAGITGQVTAQHIYDASRRDGIYASAKADGSAPVAILFTPRFPVALFSINGIVFVNYSGADTPSLAYKITVPSVLGFEILVLGGLPNTTVDIHYGATGE